MKSFVQMKGQLDDILEEKNNALKKAALEIAKMYAGNSSGSASEEIDKLLSQFSDHDKYYIMKYAFLRMI